ncbi:putative leader peptide [Pseudonocardia yunnanensis]|uniref:Leader peptide n=1 Tax=Pseudonocardia yunnanensis TaxID=58107 RepID=A0ABW4F8W4_9PSEU
MPIRAHARRPGGDHVDAAPERRRRVPLVRRHHVDLCRTSTAICPR